MRLLLSTAALSVATGGTVVTPSLRANLDTQVHQGPAAAGAECLLVNSFKLGGISSAKSHDGGANAVDTGILSCPSAYTCVEDPSSSMGGRCVSLSHRDYSGHQELYFDTQVHRSLAAIPCNLSNGTSSKKCDGYNACAAIDPLGVPCGSCNGNYACPRQVNVTLGEGSCNGNGACRAAESSSIGAGSCNGDAACDNVKRVTIGSGSCVGTSQTCFGVVDTTIGARSCVGFKQCSYFKGTIGNEACTGDKIPGDSNLFGFACFKASGKIGDKSCYEYASCYQKIQYFHNFVVGTNSCRGKSACGYFDAVTIGNDSCSGSYSCYNSYSSVGTVSCNGINSCANNKGPIGGGSCNGDFSCRNNLASIGDCNCNGNDACYGNELPRLNNCTASPTMKPTSSPTTRATVNPTKGSTGSPVNAPTTSAPTTRSPTQSPTNTGPSKPPSPSMSPTSVSPTKIPTLSPSVPPTVSPTRRPTVSPTNIPSSLPSKSPTFITSTTVVLEGNLVLDANCTSINSTFFSSAAVIQETINQTIQSTLKVNQVLETVNVSSICGSPVQLSLASRRLQGSGAPVSFAALLTESCNVKCSSNPEIAQALADSAESVLINSINGGNFTVLMQTIASNVNNTVLANAGVNNVTSKDFSFSMVTVSPTSSPTKPPTNAPTRKPTRKPIVIAKSSKTTPKPIVKPSPKPSPPVTKKPVSTKASKKLL